MSNINNSGLNGYTSINNAGLSSILGQNATTGTTASAAYAQILQKYANTSRYNSTSERALVDILKLTQGGSTNVLADIDILDLSGNTAGRPLKDILNNSIGYVTPDITSITGNNNYNANTWLTLSSQRRAYLSNLANILSQGSNGILTLLTAQGYANNASTQALATEIANAISRSSPNFLTEATNTIQRINNKESTVRQSATFAQSSYKNITDSITNSLKKITGAGS